MAVSARDPQEPLPEPPVGRGRHARGREPQQERGGAGRWFAETAIIIVSALVLSALVRAFLVQAFYVPSASMEDTLLISDRIIASKITTTMSGVSRGEVIVFKDPGDKASISVTGTALAADGTAPPAGAPVVSGPLTVTAPVPSANGFSVSLENADPNAEYVPSSSAGTVTMGSLTNESLPFVVSGLQPGESATLTIAAQGGNAWLPAPDAPPGGLRGAIRTGLTFVGLLPSDSGSDLVKRVIGVGGDRVQCCSADGQIVLNGVPLMEDYIKGPTDQVQFDVVVPEGGVFVMGDNRGDSRDSRFHLDENNGAVPTDDVVGRVVVVLWPLNRIATVPIPDIFGNPQITQGAKP